MNGDTSGSPATPDREGLAGRPPAQAPAADRTVPHRPPHRGRRTLLAALAVLLGVTALLYPVLVTRHNNDRQRDFARQYEDHVKTTDRSTFDTWFYRARRYNKTLDGIPILDPWLSKATAATASGPYRHYLYQLSLSEPMARLRVPSVGIDLPVRHGTSDDTLAAGVGHLYGTALPVGGPGTHSVLTTHTGLSNATLFDHLSQVSKGQVFFVDVAGRTLAYRVDDIAVVLPEEIGRLAPVAGKDYLTLFTCTPYAVNTHRLLVRGVAVPYTPELAKLHDVPIDDGPGLETWMWWMLGGAGAGIVVLCAIGVSELRRRRRPTTASDTPDDPDNPDADAPTQRHTRGDAGGLPG